MRERDEMGVGVRISGRAAVIKEAEVKQEVPDVSTNIASSIWVYGGRDNMSYLFYWVPKPVPHSFTEGSGGTPSFHQSICFGVLCVFVIVVVAVG